MPIQALETLEFPHLRVMLAREAKSEQGRLLALELTPTDEWPTVTRNLTLTTEARRFSQEVGRLSVGDLPDPTSILEQLRIAGTRLETDQLQTVLRFMQVGISLQEMFRPVRDEFPTLNSVFHLLPNLSKLYQTTRRILLPTGEIDERASSELRRIRQEIQHQRARIHRQLEGMLRQAELEPAFSDQIITQRNGRFVLPIRSDHRGHLPGVVHAASSSGATVFIEPIGTIELNNEMVRLQDMEEAEIARILFQITEALRTEHKAIEQLTWTLAEIDFLAAKARFAETFNAVEPKLNTDGVFSVIDARHPLLESRLLTEGGKIVPISFTLNSADQVMIISGPNAGGKTVVLKTAGICALMAQSGLHVPAREANICLFHQIHADIGDHQSLAANLSTFSSHITNIRTITETVAAPALVLIDEIGTGTDPDEGAALGTAIVDFLRSQTIHTIVSTHYNPLKVYADTTDGVFNASVEFDFETLQPTYRLLTTQAGASSGIEIARRLGISPAILDLATQKLGSRERDLSHYLEKLKSEIDYHHDSNVALEEERATLAERYARLDHQFAERELARQKVFTETLNELRDEFFEQVRPLLTQISDQVQRSKAQHSAERAVEKLARAANEKFKQQNALRLVKPTPPPTLPQLPEPARTEEPGVEEGELRVGDLVRTDLGQEGIIESIQQGMLLVRVGSMRLKTASTHVRRISKSKSQAGHKSMLERAAAAAATSHQPASEESQAEINLIGCTAEEARDRADKFLDDAAMHQMSQVRIIHGMGMGILRREIENLLEGHPHVARFYKAPNNQGGAGATIVELRQ
ncbi:MAG TPA: endonuclease MutS2 [Acidobacteriota bacterium]|nr:endonuclease MutS2 [Acidobacteriota bacterium]